MTHRWPLVFFIAVAAACLSAPSPAAVPAPTASPAAAAAPQPSPTLPPAPIPAAIRWVRDSAEHHALFLQIYRQATEQVDREATKRAPGTWAVVLDADETVIDNSAYALARAQGHQPVDATSWRQWETSLAAVPLPGAAAFLARVHELKGKIAIVTNRPQSVCPATEALFRAHDLPFDVMLCKPDAGPNDKNPRFEAVANGTTPAGLPPLAIVAFLGDNIFDFPKLSQAIAKQGDEAFAQFGVRFFVFPNPMYGSWR
jgi:5'-nucleotidase (lipoprotein e(P4) family)